jgi:hypothetical protein
MIKQFFKFCIEIGNYPRLTPAEWVQTIICSKKCGAELAIRNHRRNVFDKGAEAFARVARPLDLAQDQPQIHRFRGKRKEGPLPFVQVSQARFRIARDVEAVANPGLDQMFPGETLKDVANP